ncbi:MAG TPA: acyltransferase family protein, partial [Herminiimonas sp.]|nr:acyltransferase family protein [Herminiimonas sp.]
MDLPMPTPKKSTALAPAFATEADSALLVPTQVTLSHHLHASYRRDIDGLRALAVLSVVIYHAFPQLLRGGFAGVDIFFVISGFLISGIIFKNLERGDFSFADFYGRRIRRIFPALTLMMGSCLAFGWFALLPGEFATLGQHVIAGVGFLSNILLWRENGYFNIASDLKPLLHLWSLGIEEQFYLFWPVIALVAYRRKVSLINIAIFLALASFVINVAVIDIKPAATFFLLPSRLWELMAGSILAYVTLYQDDATKRRLKQLLRILPDDGAGNMRLANLASGVGLLLLVLTMFAFNSSLAFPGWYALLPVTGAALMIFAGPQAWLNRKFLSNNFMVAIGLISYPLYLWHWPVLAYLRIADRSLTIVSGLSGLALSLALSWLTYRFCEQPIRFSHGSTKKVLTLSLLGLSLAMAAAGYAVMHKAGFPGRISSALLAKNAVFAGKPPSPDVCQQGYKFSGDLCHSNRLAQSPDVILIGDSHAAQTYSGLAIELEKKDKALLMVGMNGCPPLFNIFHKTTACDKFINPAFEIAERSSAKTIILAGRGPLYMLGTSFGAVEHHKDGWYAAIYRPDPSLPSKDAYAKAIDESFKRLSKTGKNIIFILDNPELGFHTQECIDVRP